jgi:ribose transport system permease protein
VPTATSTSEATGAPAPPRPRRLARLAFARDYGILGSVAGLFIALCLLSDAFLSKTNLLNILAQNAPLGIIACGATLVIVGGGFDLSVGAIFATTGVVAAWLAVHVGAGVGLIAGVVAGLVLGLANGALVAGLGINAFVATLASALAFGGIAQLITNGQLITVDSPAFAHLGQDTLLGAKYSVWLFLGAVAVGWFVLARTTFGSWVYAVGGNPEAARLSGIHVGAVRTATFALSGLAAGVGGVIAASRVGTGQADSGPGLALEAIAAVVIGGTSIAGGEGAVWRTFFGVMLLALIDNGFNILNVNPVWQAIVEGAIIVAAVALDVRTRRSRA